MKRFIEILNSKNSDDLEDILLYFGSYETFFKLLAKKNLIHELDFDSGTFDEWGQEYVLYVMKNNNELFDKWVESIFVDVKIQNGEYYLAVDDLYDLSTLFCGRGKNNAQQYVKRTLEGEYVFDYGVYPETSEILGMIDSLSQKNLEYLKKVFIHHLKNVELYPITSVLQYISDQQPGDEPIQINDENVDLIFNDQETLEYILENDLESTVYSNLIDLYIHSSETDMNDQFYESIMNELSGLFNMNSATEVDKKTLYEIYNFKFYVKNYIQDNYDFRYMLGNNGYYLELLSQVEECLVPKFPEYADFRGVMKIVNEYFTSEIG